MPLRPFSHLPRARMAAVVGDELSAAPRPSVPAYCPPHSSDLGKVVKVVPHGQLGALSRDQGRRHPGSLGRRDSPGCGWGLPSAEEESGLPPLDPSRRPRWSSLQQNLPAMGRSNRAFLLFVLSEVLSPGPLLASPSQGRSIPRDGKGITVDVFTCNPKHAHQRPLDSSSPVILGHHSLAIITPGAHWGSSCPGPLQLPKPTNLNLRSLLSCSSPSLEATPRALAQLLLALSASAGPWSSSEWPCEYETLFPQDTSVCVYRAHHPRVKQILGTFLNGHP